MSHVRPLCDELVVGVDAAHAQHALTAYESLESIDRLYSVDVSLPVETAFADLMSACTSSWIFRIDSDEVISTELQDALKKLVNIDAMFTHAWVPRRWLWPDAKTFITDSPWFPDLQLRLFRNHPALWDLSTHIHEPARVYGRGLTLHGPIYHLDLIRNSEMTRMNKANVYESLRPGLRTTNGSSTNFCLYLPERSVQRLSLKPVEEGDALEVVRLVEKTSDGNEFGRKQVEMTTLPRNDYSGFGEFDPKLLVVRVDSVPTVDAGRSFHVGVGILNESDAAVATQRHAGGILRLGAVWQGTKDEAHNVEFRADLPELLPAGIPVFCPIEIIAPLTEGNFQLRIDLLTELVEWHNVGDTIDVQVRPSKRSEFARRWAEIDSVEGWLSIDEARLLYDLSSIIPRDQAIVEVGSYKGRSTTALALGSSGSVVVAVDPHTGDRALVDSGQAVDTYCDFISNLERLDLLTRVKPMRMTSAEAATKFEGSPIGLLFIDGWHSTDAVKSDILNWRPFCTQNTIFVFDDWNNIEVGDGIRDLQHLLPPLLGLVGKVAVFGPPDLVASLLHDAGPAWKAGEGATLPFGIKW